MPGLLRDGNVLYTGSINSIFREKNAAKQVSAGLECGITLKDFADFKEKDVIEVYKTYRNRKKNLMIRRKVIIFFHKDN